MEGTPIMSVRVGATVLAGWVSVVGCGSAAQPSPDNAPAEQPNGSPARDASATRDAKTAVAVVDGSAITQAELDGAIGMQLSEIEERLYDLRKDRLEDLIAERLIAAEAKRRGMTVEVLEQQEIAAGVTPPSDSEVAAVFERYKNQAQGNPERLKTFIRDQVHEQKRDERRRAYVSTLEKAASVDRRLTPPAPRRTSLEVDEAPVRGDVSAPVTVIEFTDFHCPYCRRVQPTLMELLAKYKGKVRLVFRHFPIDQLHPTARKASEAAWCAQQQGKFWEYHDGLFEAGNDASPAALEKVASKIGLDEAKFKTCTAGAEAPAGVNSDLEEAQRLGLTGTPTFFINGRPLVGGLPLDAFSEIIDEELGSNAEQVTR
ncbi:MAG: thioredoxin domain-containing protein [Luteitalea sp.]|nr:thioredoxin domain-containing protein [Luteitalea sp.]